MLANVAGRKKFKRFTDLKFDNSQRIIDVNLNGFLRYIQAVPPDTIEAGGAHTVGRPDGSPGRRDR